MFHGQCRKLLQITPATISCNTNHSAIQQKLFFWHILYVTEWSFQKQHHCCWGTNCLHRSEHYFCKWHLSQINYCLLLVASAWILTNVHFVKCLTLYHNRTNSSLWSFLWKSHLMFSIYREVQLTIMAFCLNSSLSCSDSCKDKQNLLIQFL